MRRSRKKRYRLEFSDWDENDLDGAVYPCEDVRWHDEIASGTYSTDEMTIVRARLDQGFKIVNGCPFVSSDTTRAPSLSMRSRPILQTLLYKFDDIQRISIPEISDHQVLILCKKND